MCHQRVSQYLGWQGPNAKHGEQESDLLVLGSTMKTGASDESDLGLCVAHISAVEVERICDFPPSSWAATDCAASAN